MSKQLTAAVIGSGASGLPAIKTCLEYGINVTCFEKTNDIGGLWRYKAHDCDGEASVAKSTVINTSKERMAYTDFPPPKEFANFMHNRRVMEYFRLYADNFKLIEHIRFNTEVLELSKADDYNSSGKWSVKILDKKTNKTEVHFYDAVFMCTGHHVEPNIPKIPGSEQFKGKILHSHSYKDPSGFEDKKGIVVGIGNSGVDAAVELSRSSEQIYLATRRGAWIFNRVSDRGLPFDFVQGTMLNRVIGKLCPGYINYVMEKRLNARFDHETYGLKPEHRISQAHPSINDDLPNRIASGTIIVKPNIKRLTETGAIFDDGSHVNDIDFIVLATGYSFSFPYLKDDSVPVVNNEVSLFKFMMPPELSKPGLFVIGLFQPLGALNPINDMQCRVACEFLTGKSKPPSKIEMVEDIKRVQTHNQQRYVGSPRHTIQCDYEPLLMELADLIGAGINWKKLVLTDPQLAWTSFFGPVLPYHFRLSGTNPWPGARAAILGAWDRMLYPTARNKALVGAKNGLKKNGNKAVGLRWAKNANFAIAVFATLMTFLLFLVY